MNLTLLITVVSVLLALLLPTSESWGQPHEPRRGEVYKLPGHIIQDFKKDSMYAYHQAAYEFSFIGDYRKALYYGDSQRLKFPQLPPEVVAYFRQFKPVNAVDFIIKKAQDEQIILINEGHHHPLHRVFTQSLLQGLYDKGFRYFGAETLSFKFDKEINKRGYPILRSGHYTKEPQYGELIRMALGIGYEVFAYEPDNLDTLKTGRLREIGQAKNIQKVLQKDPKAKILVHAGYDHILEGPLESDWEMAMAGRLYELTGINPYTINQEILTERNKSKLDNPYTRLVKVQEPTIFMDDKGNGFAGSEGFEEWDVRVFHPKTSYLNGRPDWMFTSERRPVVLHEKINLRCPCLVHAYKAGEDLDQAVPVDVIVLKSKKDKKALALKQGRYEVLIRNKEGQEQIIHLE